MDYFDIKKTQQIDKFQKKWKSNYYAFLVQLQKSKDKELNAILIGQLIVIWILCMIMLALWIF